MKILLATDGSRYALEAARFLSTRARPDGSVKIDLVAALPPEASLPLRDSGFADGDGRGGWTRRRGGLEDTEKVLIEAGFKVEARTLTGDPREVLVEEAEDYDLVVTGVKGRGAAPFFELGSVARAVLRHAPCSVLLVRPRRSAESGVRMEHVQEDPEAPRVLLPTDGVEDGLAAAWEVFASFCGVHTKVEVVTVVEPHSVDVGQPGRGAWASRPHVENRSRARNWLRRAVRGFGPAAVPPRGRLLEGRPGAEIERRALETRADLIVLGVRGGGRPGPGPLGSTARELAWRAPCSVLMARDKTLKRGRNRLENRLQGLHEAPAPKLAGESPPLSPER